MTQVKLLTTNQLLNFVPLGKTKLQELRDNGTFAEGIHWVRYPGPNPRKILWNLSLVQDYLVTGGGKAHQIAIENYLASLPSSQPRTSRNSRA